MKKGVIILIFAILIILGTLRFLYAKYVQEKIDIFYIESESLLYRYYDDYFYAHNKKFQYDEFVESIATKDEKLYQLLKGEKIVLFPNKGFVYVRYKKSNKFIENNPDFTFPKFLFSTVNIGIDRYNSHRKLSYEREVVYQYKNYSFVEKEGFNWFLLRAKYAEIMHCKSKWVGECDSRCNQAMAVIFPQEVVLMNSEFDRESDSIIKQVLKDKYTSPNDTLMVIVKFYNFKEAKCAE